MQRHNTVPTLVVILPGFLFTYVIITLNSKANIDMITYSLTTDLEFLKKNVANIYKKVFLFAFCKYLPPGKIQISTCTVFVMNSDIV